MSIDATYFTSLIALALLVAFFFWLYPEYRVDTLKNKLYEIRGQLLKDATAGNLPLDSEAYSILRQTIDGFLKRAEKLTTLHVLIQLIADKLSTEKKVCDFLNDIGKAIEPLNKKEKDLVIDYVGKINLTVTEHLLISSPLLWVFVLMPICVVLLFFVPLEKASAFFKSQLNNLDMRALVSARIRD